MREKSPAPYEFLQTWLIGAGIIFASVLTTNADAIVAGDGGVQTLIAPIFLLIYSTIISAALAGAALMLSLIWRFIPAWQRLKPRLTKPGLILTLIGLSCLIISYLPPFVHIQPTRIPADTEDPTGYTYPVTYLYPAPFLAVPGFSLMILTLSNAAAIYGLRRKKRYITPAEADEIDNLTGKETSNRKKENNNINKTRNTYEIGT